MNSVELIHDLNPIASQPSVRNGNDSYFNDLFAMANCAPVDNIVTITNDMIDPQNAPCKYTDFITYI